MPSEKKFQWTEAGRVEALEAVEALAMTPPAAVEVEVEAAVAAVVAAAHCGLPCLISLSLRF